MQLPLRRDVGASDLVSDHDSAVVGQQFVDETVLDLVCFGGSLRADGFLKLGKPLVLNAGLGEKVGGGSHLNMLAIANSCGPDSALLEPEAQTSSR